MAHAFWTDEEKQFIWENRTLTATEMLPKWLEKFGDTRSTNALEKQILRTRKKTASVSAPVVDQIDVGISWLDGVLAAAKTLPKPPKQPESGERTRVIFLSDLHFGQQHHMFNKPFDHSVARERVTSIPHMLQGPKPDKVIVALGGDCVEGENIYPNQQVHIEFPAIEQAQHFATATWEMLIGLHKQYKCPVEVFTVPGNHGRTDKSASELSNWDNVGYLILQTLSSVSELPISVHYNASELYLFETQGKRILLNHHGVKHTGTPAMRVKLAGWRELFEFNILLHGHWHEAKVGQWFGQFVICNGSLGGVNQYATKLAVGSPPMQVYFDLVEGQPFSEFRLLSW